MVEREVAGIHVAFSIPLAFNSLQMFRLLIRRCYLFPFNEKQDIKSSGLILLSPVQDKKTRQKAQWLLCRFNILISLQLHMRTKYPACYCGVTTEHHETALCEVLHIKCRQGKGEPWPSIILFMLGTSHLGNIVTLSDHKPRGLIKQGCYCKSD